MVENKRHDKDAGIEIKAKANQLDFLYELHTQEVEIGEEAIAMLRANGYIKDIPLPTPKPSEEVRDDWRLFNDPNFVDQKNKFDKNVDLVHESDAPESGSVFTEEDYRKLVEEKGSVIRSGMLLDIQRKDWLPQSLMDHTKEFVEWIDSISFQGFANRINYRRFNLYCQQAYQWLSENGSLSNYLDYEDRENYKDKEIDRCSQNSLYALNKYLKLKEASMTSGMREYVATPAHEILLYLLDCGYSFYLGKPRQIAATSTIGGFALVKTMFNRNHFIKFITENDKKGQEIFEDKIKYPFAEMPDWMRDDSRHDSGTKFMLGTKEKKGDREGTNSNIDVVPPTPTAISGGSPQIALVDEAGNIGIFDRIVKDARPTSFWMNPVTKRMERKRQLVGWGTGGDMEKGGRSFEGELTSALKDWKERKFDSGIIPIFLDWTTRPGITKEIYDSEKAFYYSKVGPDAENSRIMFRQQYPSSVEDMFLTTAKTLVSQEYIADALDRIIKTKATMKPQYGYFEPIYGDKEQPEGSDVPFDVIGANFVPLESGDPRVTTTIFQHPKQGWVNRYYQGTDPIASDTGMSNMASAIWDIYYNTVSAVVDFRSGNYREVYLQVVLLGIYYDLAKNVGVKELLETNIGKAYQQYKEYKGRFDTLVFNTELPEPFQTGSGNLVGIDNRGIRNKMIIDNMFEMIQAFGQKNYIEIFFIQLKTFVSTVTARGNETWGPANRKIYKDDVLFAVTFAYICAQCFPLDKCYKIDSEKKNGLKMVSTLAYDKDFNLRRVYKKVKVDG